MNHSERNAFIESLFEKYYKHLMIVAAGYFCNDQTYRVIIEEIVQDVFEVAVKKADTLANHAKVDGWLAKVLFHKLDNYRGRTRTEQNKTTYSMDKPNQVEIADTVDIIERWREQIDAQSCIDALYALLAEQERDVFQDFFIHGMTAKAVAEKRSLAVTAVKAAIRRIRKKATEIRSEHNFTILIIIGILLLFEQMD